MRYPTSADLVSLLGMDAEAFAGWLNVGLSEYLLERRGREAFSEVRNFVDQGEGNIVADLRRIFDVLPARHQEIFKDGVSRLIQRLDYSRPAHASVAMAALELGTAIAAHDLLRIVAGKSFSMSGAHGARLFDLTFELSAQLADLDPFHAVDCLRHLIEHKNLFEPQLAGRALLALSQAKPDLLVEHFLVLEDSLNRKYGYVAESEDETRRLKSRARLLDGLSRRVPNKRLFVSVLERAPGQFQWWHATLALKMPEVLHDVAIAGSVSPAPDTQMVRRRVSREGLFNQVRAVVGEALLQSGAAAERLLKDQAESLGLGLRYASTGFAELALAVVDLGAAGEEIARCSNENEDGEW